MLSVSLFNSTWRQKQHDIEHISLWNFESKIIFYVNLHWRKVWNIRYLSNMYSSDVFLFVNVWWWCEKIVYVQTQNIRFLYGKCKLKSTTLIENEKVKYEKSTVYLWHWFPFFFFLIKCWASNAWNFDYKYIIRFIVVG